MMEWWNDGMMEWWNDGVMEWWNDGIMEFFSFFLLLCFSKFSMIFRDSVYPLFAWFFLLTYISYFNCQRVTIYLPLLLCYHCTGDLGDAGQTFPSRAPPVPHPPSKGKFLSSPFTVLPQADKANGIFK